jgi:DNA processing protein
MTGTHLTDEQRIAWLRLIRSESVGPRTFRALVNRFGGAGPALDALPDLARRGGRLILKVATREEALREIEAAERLGVRFVAAGEPDYPKILATVDTSPPLVALRGDAACLAKPMVALVGSRNASAAGLTFAGRLAGELGAEGYVVVSGLARGVDTSAHRSALRTGTVAVLAGGQDRIYPQSNVALAEQIVGEGGAILSEMPMGWEPRGRDFPRRNRIVSGLCYGVVVVEAARRSGSLITARFALEQGREVFAVPGSPLDPRAEGTNDLIREGATLCASVDHVTAVLAPLLGRLPEGSEGAGEPGGEGRIVHEPLWDELDLDDIARAPAAPIVVDGWDAPTEASASEDSRRVVVDLLGPSPIRVDDLARQSGVPVRTIQLILLELELGGRLERHGGNAVSLLTR